MDETKSGKAAKKVNSTLRRLSLLSLGIYAEAEDKVREYIDDLVADGEISKEEGKKFLKELKENSKKQKKDFDEKVHEKISKSSRETNKKIEELEEKIRVLEEQLAEKGKKLIDIEEDEPSGKTAAQRKNAEALRKSRQGK